MNIRREAQTALAACGAVAILVCVVLNPAKAQSQRDGADGPVPSPRSGFAMAYDSRRDQVVLFGGVSANDQRPLGDTWVWDGAGWRQIEGQGPAPRRYSAMAFDSRRGVMVLFGGWDAKNVALGDTWEFDGQKWKQASAEKAPPARFESAMAYDSNRGVAVLFGGRGARRNLLGDLWEWNGQSWREAPAAGPYARAGHAMIYNEAHGTTLVLGGFTSTALNDAWEFDGKMWTQLESSKLPARHEFAMVYDTDNDRVLLFGGAGRGQRLNDLWIWSSNTWNRGPSAAPMARSMHGGVYRPGHGFLIFGGLTDNASSPDSFHNDMWMFDGQRWRPQWN